MSLLERPEAQALLEDAAMTARTVGGCADRLTGFLARYLPLFYREEPRKHLRLAVEGRLSGLQRKTSEPIAREADVPRRGLQRFVGAGEWDDEAAMAELRRHAGEELGDPQGVLILDPSGFAKKGQDSCGVARQWCGRLGKVDNCQVGVYLAYASPAGSALVDRQLYLPEERAADRQHRKKTHVPKEVVFQEKWRIGLQLIDRSGAELPFAWVTGDDEFGRASAFRAQLRVRRLRYVLDIPCNTLIRVVGAPAAPGRRWPAWQRVDQWGREQPSWRWRKIRIRDGTKGPLVVRALTARVQARDEDGCAGKLERLTVIRTIDRQPQVWYTLSNALEEVSDETVVQVHSQRHGIEDLLQAAKGEVGLGHYEVRSWTGWHHHMTLCLLALWFLVLEKRRLGKKNTGHHALPSARDLHGTLTPPAAPICSHRSKSKRSSAA